MAVPPAYDGGGEDREEQEDASRLCEGRGQSRAHRLEGRKPEASGMVSESQGKSGSRGIPRRENSPVRRQERGRGRAREALEKSSRGIFGLREIPEKGRGEGDSGGGVGAKIGMTGFKDDRINTANVK